MSSANHGNRRTPPSPNTRLRDMFRVGTMVFSVLVAWLAFRPSAGVETGLPWDKANHFAAFLVWTGLIACGWPRAGVLRVAAIMLALGIGIELIQGLPAVGRDADGWDVVADMTGFVISWAMLALLKVRERLTLRV